MERRDDPSAKTRQELIDSIAVESCCQPATVDKLREELPHLTELAMVIGPEGGMSQEEVAQMRSALCRPVTLGPRILRTETAGLAALSALFCLYGDMD